MLSKPLAAGMILVVTATALWVGWEYGHRKGYELGMVKCMTFGDPTDPPIIIHGGSLHLNTVAANDPQSGTTISIPTNHITTVQLGGYYDTTTGNAAPSPIAFTTNWEVDACNDSTCANGLRLCSATPTPPATGCDTTTSLPSNSAGIVAITSFAGGDEIFHSQAPKQFSGDWRYRLRLRTDGDGNKYHPAFVIVKSGTSTTTYSCGPTSPGSPPVTDWGQCWIAAGSGY